MAFNGVNRITELSVGSLWGGVGWGWDLTPLTQLCCDSCHGL